ncbi:MAG: [FeFe] hydrogenase H-cluster radical SAM maturase HydE [Elusimicrobiota bacterium]|jgi:biotin synthase
MERSRVLSWLREEDPGRLEELWARADEARRAHAGDEVHLRGLVELSNRCVRSCGYCGIRAGASVERYRLSEDEVLSCAREAVAYGYGTLVLQAGEDPSLDRADVETLVRRIKAETPLAVTLSLGERDEGDLAAWRAAGADRYLLRFETSDPELYRLVHPSLPGRPSDRIALLRVLKGLGYETGSGVMLGLPGQTFASVADDLLLFRELDLDMIGVGPYLAHPGTPLGRGVLPRDISAREQVPATELMTYKVVALARLLRPDANIPSTTALATLNRAGGREHGLRRGANVVMPNLTPVRCRPLYEIYPAKACVYETADSCHACLLQRIRSLGRVPGTGPGSRRGRAVSDSVL